MPTTRRLPCSTAASRSSPARRRRPSCGSRRRRRRRSSFTDDSGAKPTPLPPDLGTALLVVEFPPLDPAEEAKMDPNFMMKIIGERAPTRGRPVRHPLMHRTRTVDYAVVLSGELDMMLDDAVVHVRAGDVIVQQATNHAWINRGTQPCRILFALIDSRQP